MSQFGDKRLAQRAARGDQRAFEQIYRRYHQQLYRFCLTMLGNPHDAQDALQNAMVKVLRALPGEEREIELKPWLYRIARNEAVETIRRRPDRLEPVPELEAPARSQVAELSEDRERLRRLFADLDALPGRQRAALVLRELSGLSFEEIGRALETSPATARQTVYEARLSLRQMEAGREMRCEAVTRALSDGDRRMLRRRDLRAHLRGCAPCRAFADGIAERRSELAALAPLPLAVSSGILHCIFAQAEGGVAATGLVGTGGGAEAAGAGKAIAGATLAKSAASVAVVAVAGVSTADRTGLIDVGVPSQRGGESPSAAGNAGSPAPPAAAGSPARTAAAVAQARLSGRALPQLSGGRPAGDSPPPAEAERPTLASPGESSGEGLPPGASAKPADHRGGGRSAAATRGENGSRGQGEPSRGRQTAAARKSPQGNPSPAAGPRRVGAHHKGAHPPPVQPAPSSQERDAGSGKSSQSASNANAGQAPAEQASAADEHGPDEGGGAPFQP